MLEERRQRWMQDLRNRQRNIVFPDTVLNEFRGYRFVFARNIHLTPVLRFCLILWGLVWCIGSPAFLVVAWGISILKSEIGISAGIIGLLMTGIVWLPPFYLGMRLFLVGVMPIFSSTSPVKNVRPMLGIVRRPFSQRPRQRQIQREKTNDLD